MQAPLEARGIIWPKAGVRGCGEQNDVKAEN